MSNKYPEAPSMRRSRAARAFMSSSASDSDPKTVSIAAIHFPKQQPRCYFDPAKLQQLTTSVKEHGIIEPLLVRPLQDGTYELVAGERRWRAAKEAGLSEVPIVIRQLNDEEALQLALEENLQREDLNPVEETEGILQLLALQLKIEPQQVIALLHNVASAKTRNQELQENVFLQLRAIEKTLATLGKGTPESFRVSKLPLLNLPAKVLEALRQGDLAYTKARAIARLKNEEVRNQLLDEAVTGNLSLSQIKQRAKELIPIEQQKVAEQDVSPQKRLSNIGKKMKQVWDDPKKRKKLESLLVQIEKVLGEE